MVKWPLANGQDGGSAVRAMPGQHSGSIARPGSYALNYLLVMVDGMDHNPEASHARREKSARRVKKDQCLNELSAATIRG